MTLRIGFDMDGVLADFASAFHEVDVRLFGAGRTTRAGAPEEEEETPANATGTGAVSEQATLRESRRQRDAIWHTIRSTPDFWTTLKPVDAGAVRRIHDQMLRHRWEVFFITQRPETQGETVQRQTQRWLIEQGFDMPSVLVIGGSRGAAAGALRLNYHVDDSPQNCLDVVSDSRAKPILIVPAGEEATARKATQLGIGVARSTGESLDILEQASGARLQAGALRRLAAMVGWK